METVLGIDFNAYSMATGDTTATLHEAGGKRSQICEFVIELRGERDRSAQLAAAELHSKEADVRANAAEARIEAADARAKDAEARCRTIASRLATTEAEAAASRRELLELRAKLELARAEFDVARSLEAAKLREARLEADQYREATQASQSIADAHEKQCDATNRRLREAQRAIKRDALLKSQASDALRELGRSNQELKFAMKAAEGEERTLRDRARTAMQLMNGFRRVAHALSARWDHDEYTRILDDAMRLP